MGLDNVEYGTYAGSSLNEYLYKISSIINGDGFIYYLIPLREINYVALEQLTLFKFSYDLEYIDQWATVPNKMNFAIINQTYSLTEQTNMTFQCLVSTKLFQFDTISEEDFDFSDTSLSIWPRPCLNKTNGNWSTPQTELLINSDGLSLQVNDNSSLVTIKISEQWQGVPINQTAFLISGPDENAKFISFSSGGVLKLNLSSVSEAGTYTITIQNQQKLIDMSSNSANYIFDDPVSFKISINNDPPKLISSLVMKDAYVGQKYIFTLNFTDVENDKVSFKLRSESSTISDTYSNSSIGK